MKPERKLILSAFVIILFVTLKFCCKPIEKQEHSTTPASELKKELSVIEKDYEGQINRLYLKSDSLERVIKANQGELLSARKKSFVLENRISVLLKKEPATDSMQIFADCDSLKAEVSEFLEYSADKDSLCDEIIAGLTQDNQLKDSALTVSAQTIQSLRQLSATAISGKATLEKENQRLSKKLRRQQTISRIGGFAAAVLTTALTLFILK